MHLLDDPTFLFTFSLPSCISNPFWKGVYSKRKEFAPIGSKFFPLEWTHFLKEDNPFDIVASLESVSIPLKRLQAFMYMDLNLK